MISPINTVIVNNEETFRRYRFTGFSISLGGKGGNDTFRCNGDIFTKIENNSEAEMLLVDHKIGRITIAYEVDTDFKATETGDIVVFSGRAQLMYKRHIGNRAMQTVVTGTEEQADASLKAAQVEYMPERTGAQDPAYKGMFTTSVAEPPKTAEPQILDQPKYEPGEAPTKGQINGVEDLPVQMFGMDGASRKTAPRSLEEMPTVEFGTDDGMKNAIKSAKDLPEVRLDSNTKPKTRRGRKPGQTIKVD